MRERTLINAELLGRTLKHIKETIDRWNQSWWSIATDNGTAHCYAGWAVTLSGIIIQHEPIGGWAFVRPEDVPAGIDGTFWMYRDDRFTVPSVAASLLGLSEEQAKELFNPENDMEDLERIVGELIGLALEEEINASLEEGLGDLPEETLVEKSLPGDDLEETETADEKEEEEEAIPF